MTLRITRMVGPRLRTTLILEGSLVAPEATLLEHECAALLRATKGVNLDLTGVHFVDRAGIEALERLDREGVDIRCRPGTVAGVLEGEGIRVKREEDGGDSGRT